MQQSDLIPTVAVAEILGVHVRTVHRYVEADLITPAVKVPGLRGALMFDRRDAELLKIRREQERAA